MSKAGRFIRFFDPRLDREAAANPMTMVVDPPRRSSRASSSIRAGGGRASTQSAVCLT